MPFLSCKLYKIEVPKADNAEKLFENRGSMQYGKEYGNPLNFIVRPQRSIPEFGQLTNVYYDRIITVRTLDPQTLEVTGAKIPQTEGPVTVFLYRKAPLEYCLGVFANFSTAEKIAEIVNVILGQDTQGPSLNLHKIQFLLDQKEKEIRGIPDFSNVSEISVEDINDLYIDAVWMKGSQLDSAPEYRKWVTDELSGGHIRFLTLSYKDRAFYLLSDGRIFTKQGRDPEDDYLVIHELVLRLSEVSAVRI